MKSVGRLGLPLLQEEEAEQRDDGESREANRSNVEGDVAAGDGLNLEQVGGLVAISGLPEPDLFTSSVECVNPNEICGGRDVSYHGPSEIVVGRGVWLDNYLFQACLVLFQVVHRLPPPPILLADRGIAQLHFHRLVARVCPYWEARVERPCHRDFVFSGF